MSRFSFGTNPSTPAFGQPAFGAQPAGSITFGTPVSSAVGNTSFGQPQPTASAFGSSFSGFGTQPTQQQQQQQNPNYAQNPLNQSIGGTAPTLPSTGFGFGSLTAAAPTQPTAGFGFGSSTAAQPTQPTTGFGFGSSTAAPTQPTTGFGFGSSISATPQTGFGFGTAQTQPSQQQQQQPQQSTGMLGSGFGFGATAPTTASGLGLSFGGGATTTAGTSTGFNFGAPIASSIPSTGFNLGSNPITSTNLSFGTQPSTSTGFGLSTSIPSGGLFPGFSAPTTTTASTGFSLPVSTTTTPNLGLTFGPPSTASSFSFGPTTTVTSSMGLLGNSFGLSGLTKTTSTTTTTPSMVGLGGIVQSTPKTGANLGAKEVVPKEENLPQELQQTVESFKAFVKQQKSYSTDVAQCSVKEFKKVAQEIETVSNLLKEVEKKLQTNRAVSEKLKNDTAKVLQYVEMAQRTHDTPILSQYENTAPMEFFTNLIDGFEREMHTLKVQIEATDKYVKNLGKPSELTSDDLSAGMRKLHDSFVALAGRLQQVHGQVQAQKEQYLNLRRYMLHDDTNVFEKPRALADVTNATVSVDYKPPSVPAGPTPFSALAHHLAAANQTQPVQNTGFLSQSAHPLFGTPTTQPTATNLFGTSFNTTFGQPQQSSLFNTSGSSFQLQKPPTGNKRAK